ncbi:polymorphic toxin type 50 domain-containing protein [Lapidilactobacillus mulanensis]|uniref:polymorphic toxin type 50 domain-containing protein n=1 Tax=Lapidilactobacillus mulanensis TaxID=2485999 RepID=UPI000F7900C8
MCWYWKSRKRPLWCRRNTEIVYLKYDIGIEGSTGNKVSGIQIHHSKQRTHIVPQRRE